MTRLDPPLELWREPDWQGRERAMIIHDIRSALNGVTGGIALIDRSRIDAALLPQFDRMAAAAEVLARLVDAAVADRPEPAEAAAEPVRLGDLVGFVRRRWTGEAAEKGLALRIDAGPDLPERILVDFVDLARVVGNLLGNAVKFSDAGTITFAVRRQPEGGIVVAVRDEGPGVGGLQTARLCDYGFRQGRSRPGQGIGLHIARDLAERMGGRLDLDEPAAGGLTATLHLPARLCLGRPAGTPAGTQADRPMPSLAGRRILLAEDNPTNQLVASQMLGAQGAEVVLAADGVEALTLFETAAFDLVVIDIEMPRLSGLEVIRTIRGRADRRARTPIVALTAYALKEHRLRIAEAGADGLISKPIISAESFGRAVAQHLRQGSPTAEEAGMGDPATVPVIDTTVYRTLVDTIGGEMMAELLDRIVIDLDAARAGLAAALDPLDLGAIRAHSHILISVAGAFGASRLRCRAGRINTAAHGNASALPPAEVRACLEEIPRAIEFVRSQRSLC